MNDMTDQTLAAPIARQDRQIGFSRYQSLLIVLLALTQFTIILDFTIMSPLGAILMPSLNITAGQFGVAVSAYAFSAGISGILAAGFADRFDRKRLLLFFYVGFTLGTMLCAVAQNYHVLLLGRIVTGLFGSSYRADSALCLPPRSSRKLRMARSSISTGWATSSSRHRSSR